MFATKFAATLKNLFGAAAQPQVTAPIALNDIMQILGAATLLDTQQAYQSLITAQTLNDGVLALTMKLPIGFSGDPQQLHAQIVNIVTPLGVQEVNLHLIQQKAAGDAPANKAALPKTANAMPQANKPATPPTQSSLPAHPRIKHIVVVASGKGGVGKSTTTVNLALALHAQGLRIGVLDADIYGPSIPTMLGVAGITPVIEDEQFVPILAHGLAVLSVGNLTGDDNTPVVWRGPKATGALMQLYNQTLWPELDILLIDMPPGTGDIQLTLAQRIPVSGAIIVTTPQHVALLDAQKGIEMFNKVNIPVLGVVENMSLHVCSQCQHVDEIFGTGGGASLGEKYQIPLLGKLPLDANIRQDVDVGKPSVLAGGQLVGLYTLIASAVCTQLVALPTLPARVRDEKRIF